MKRSAPWLVILLICLSFLAVQPARGQALGTNFTYQGQLKQAGGPLNGTVDFQFLLFNLPSSGVVVGSPNPINNVNVVDGQFTVSLDFGASTFNGSQRWLEIAVRSPAGSGSFTTLSPRQPLTAAPYALYALNGPGSSGPWTTSGNSIFNTNTGSVGIGMAAPSSKLDIQASNGSNVLFGRRTGGGLAHNMYIDSGGNGSMQLLDSGGTPRVEFANGLSYLNYGNVGIGTTAPAESLHIADDDPVMVLQDPGSAATQTGYLGFWNSTSETGWIGYGSAINSDLSIVNTRTNGWIRFLTHGTEQMAISTYGAVGIGTPSPFIGTALHVAGTGSSVAIFDRPGDGVLVRFRTANGYQGDVSVSGSTVSYNGFMGSHYGWTNGEHSIERGALVRMAGENRRLNDSAEGDVVYGIELAARANDPALLGAYLGIMEPDKPADLANPHLIAAVGNGEMLVVDSGTGDIQPGDYLISSDVEGHAMLDDPARLPIGHVIARAAEVVEWAGVTETVGGRRRQRISVFFESFERGSAADAEIASLRAEVDELKELVHQLTSTRNGGSNQ